MAVPRDPAFWKRFSTAVHMDEEAAQSPDFKQIHQYVPPLPFPSLLHTHIPYPLWFLSDPFTDFFFFPFSEIPGSHDNNANPLDGHGSVMDSGLVL